MGTKKLRTYAKNVVRHRCTCRFCGSGFAAARPDAEFCCKAHRQADYRLRKKAHREMMADEDRRIQTLRDNTAVAQLRKPIGS